MSVESLGFKNYKPFLDGQLDFKPLNIFLGANSVGKSSVIQLILLLVQTFKYDGQNEAALRINGDMVQQGEVSNIFYKKDIDQIITLSFCISAQCLKGVRKKVSADLEILEKVFIQYGDDNIDDYADSASDLERIENIKIGRKKYKGFLRQKPGNADSSRHKSRRESFLEVAEKVNIVDIENACAFVNAIQEIDEQLWLDYCIAYNANKRKLEVRNISLRTKEKCIIGYGYENVRRGRRHSLSSHFISANVLERYQSSFGNYINFDGLQLCRKNERGPDTISSYFWSAEGPNRIRYFEDVICYLFRASIGCVANFFAYQQISYISPLRAYPKRYYFTDTGQSRYDGTGLVETLMENKAVKRSLNGWLERFHLKTEVASIRETIHKICIQQNSLDLDITDVGFGISQVLPILVQGFLMEEDSLLMVEQPEIHLHPKMQAELADLFIEIIEKSENKKIIIETHSEYLIKRLRRRMAEGVIKPEDVGIYLFHPPSKDRPSAVIERVEIGEKGNFVWPEEFYSNDLEDTMEFLRHQI